MKNFYKSSKNALKRGRRKPEKKEEPAADIDRKQAHGGGGEIRTHVPVARQTDFESKSSIYTLGKNRELSRQ